MRLSDLLADLRSAAPDLLVGGPSPLKVDPQVSAVVQDDRRVSPGALFVARRGERFDGHDHAVDAVARGAVAVVGDRPAARLRASGPRVPYVRVVDAKRALPHLAAAFHGHPSRHLSVHGVTGTDGKTTTSFLLAHLLGSGFRTGLVSTAAVRLGDETLQPEGHFTTPESPEVQAYLARFREAGATHAVLESSSHGFSQHRLDAVQYAVGVVTNLSPEHLDHHKTLDAYLEAKATLVRRARTAVLNLDDEHWEGFDRAAREGGAKVVTYGASGGADVRLLGVSQSSGALDLELDVFGERRTASLPMVGRYNAWNAAGALAAAHLAGVDLDAALQALHDFAGVPGRMQVVTTGPFTVIVDFAHTPPALKKALEATRRPGARTIVVIGSAGERDPGKRGPLGAAAAEGADVAVFTEEDSRSEPVGQILEAMAAGAGSKGGVRGVTYHLEPDRERAIALAYELAAPGDVVMLAGKGHEATLERENETLPWDEAALARSLLPGSGA